MTNLTTKPNHFDAHERSTITPDATTLGLYRYSTGMYVLNCLQRIDKPSRHSSTSAHSIAEIACAGSSAVEGTRVHTGTHPLCV